ncbi:leucine-rich repeat-containing protein 43 [Rhea pennata]|uniref:leucine-rich repeat-containing protein 43 n=1 Tax=Rhea pennata TaxID=8795 RepID=UPI002E2626CC
MAGPGGRSVSAAFREHLRHRGPRDLPPASPGTARPPGPRAAGLSPPQRPHGRPQDEPRRRQRAARAPGLLRDGGGFGSVRVLRLVDKGPVPDAGPGSLQVDEVDEGLLRFQRLEELVLSANRIGAVPSANLPRTLKVLELYGNAVGDLRDLCCPLPPPPRLQHLGLGGNRLGGSSQALAYLAADFWPNLVSLDLSFNALADLPGLLSALSALRELRVLVLQGNPLALLPAYRAFVVDSLPRLFVLDDVHIGPDERHRYRGLAGRPGLAAGGARVAVCVGAVRGLPEPGAPGQPGAGPAVAYRYRVTYEFAAGEDAGDPQVAETSWQPVEAAQDPHGGDMAEDEVPDPAGGGGGCVRRAPPVRRAAKVFATAEKPWADPMDCGYRREHAAPDLVGLKAFLEAGTVLSVVEEKVLSWPLGPDAEGTVKEEKAGRGLQRSAEVPGPGDKQKKKKKKEKPRELRSDPPVQRTLGARRVSLKGLLATEGLVATVCDLGIPTAEEPPGPPTPEEKNRRKGKDKSRKPKEGRESETSQKTTASARGDGGLAGKGKTKEAVEPEEGRGVPPAPLTVQFQMQLLRWPAVAEAQQPVGDAAAAGKAHQRGCSEP